MNLTAISFKSSRGRLPWFWLIGEIFNTLSTGLELRLFWNVLATASQRISVV